MAYGLKACSCHPLNKFQWTPFAKLSTRVHPSVACSILYQHGWSKRVLMNCVHISPKSSYNLRHLPPAEITIGSAKIKPSQSIRNLSVMLNPTLSLSNHVDMLRRSINFHVRNHWRIRRYIDQNTCHHVARALITSRLDYCNAMFTVLSSKDLARLQRLQNSAARVIFAVSRRVDASFSKLSIGCQFLVG